MNTSFYGLDPESTLGLRDRLLAEGAIAPHDAGGAMFDVVGTRWVVWIRADWLTGGYGSVEFAIRPGNRRYARFPEYKDAKKRAEVETVKRLFAPILVGGRGKR